MRQTSAVSTFGKSWKLAHDIQLQGQAQSGQQPSGSVFGLGILAVSRALGYGKVFKICLNPKFVLGPGLFQNHPLYKTRARENDAVVESRKIC